MNMKIKMALFVIVSIVGLSGCSTGIQSVDQKINQVKEAAESEVKANLQTQIQKQVDQLKENNPQFAALLAQKDNLNGQWQALQNTELAEHSFFSAFGYEYLAKINGNGTVQVVQRKTDSGEEKIYKEYKLLIDGNGKVQVQ